MDDAFIIGMQPTMDGRLSTDELCRQVGENTGNLVYAHAISSHIEGRPRVLRFRTPAETLNRAGRIGVIQGANQIGTHFSAGPDRARRLEKVTARLVIIGLGAQSDIAQTIPDLPPGALDWVRRVAEHRSEGSRNLGVRGPFTLEVLRRHGLDQHAEVIGCPSMLKSASVVPTAVPSGCRRVRVDGNLEAAERYAVSARELHNPEETFARCRMRLGMTVTSFGTFASVWRLSTPKVASPLSPRDRHRVGELLRSA